MSSNVIDKRITEAQKFIDNIKLLANENLEANIKIIAECLYFSSTVEGTIEDMIEAIKDTE